MSQKKDVTFQTEPINNRLAFESSCVLSLEKEMAAHSSVLAWRIPGTGEPGGLPSMGSHRVRHNWSDLAVVAVSYSKSYTCPSMLWWLIINKIFAQAFFLINRDYSFNIKTYKILGKYIHTCVHIYICLYIHTHTHLFPLWFSSLLLVDKILDFSSWKYLLILFFKHQTEE